MTSDHVTVLRPNSQRSSIGHSSIMSMWSNCRFVTKELNQRSRNVAGIKQSMSPTWKSPRRHNADFLSGTIAVYDITHHTP